VQGFEAGGGSRHGHFPLPGKNIVAAAEGSMRAGR
jgi:hypothetical protein